MPRAQAQSQHTVTVEKLMYGRKDAAFALSVSLRTVDTMISNKMLTTRRFGGRVLIPAADVKRLAAKITRCDMLQGSASPPEKDSYGEGSRSL